MLRMGIPSCGDKSSGDKSSGEVIKRKRSGNDNDGTNNGNDDNNDSLNPSTPDNLHQVGSSQSTPISHTHDFHPHSPQDNIQTPPSPHPHLQTSPIKQHTSPPSSISNTSPNDYLTQQTSLSLPERSWFYFGKTTMFIAFLFCS